MIANVFKQIEENKRNERQSLLADYYGLLARIDLQKPTAKDSDALADLVARLGKTAAQAHEDHQAVAEALRNVETAATRDEAEGRYVDTHEAYMAVCAERQEQFRAMNDKVLASHNEHEQANADRENAARAGPELARLKDSNPTLYRVIADKADKVIKAKAK